jgi:hypothetical protein
MFRTTLLTLTATVALMLAGPAWAGTVGAKKPSDEVTLKTGAPCPGFNGLTFDTRLNADGTTSPFTIPAGQVLILDHLSWLTNNAGAAGGIEAVDLYLSGSSEILWSVYSVRTTDLYAAGNPPLPHIPIKSGSTLCIRPEFTSLNAPYVHVHGFLTKDK